MDLQNPIVWSNNLGAIELSYNSVFHAKIKHIEIDIHFIQDKVLNREMEIQFVPTKEHIADIFTKALGTARLLYLRSKLSVIES